MSDKRYVLSVAKKLQNWSPEVVEESECSNSVPLVEKGTSEDEIGDGS